MADEVLAVTLKLPPFWPNLPIHWFHQVESQFSTRGINTERTKYDYIISSLTQEIISSIFDVVQNIARTNDATPYTTLKNALIQRFTKSDALKMETLLSDTEIGDRKPSEFFHSMKNLIGDSTMVTEAFVLNRWMKRLPVSVQASLKTVPTNTAIPDLLRIADSVYEIFQGQPYSVNAIAQPSARPNDNLVHDLVAQNNRLEGEIFEIRRMLNNLNVDNGNKVSQRDDRSRTFNSNNRNRSRSRTPSNRQLCWYHEKYGNRAHKCIKPCSFSSRSSH